MKKYVDVSDFPLANELIKNFEKIKEEFYILSKAEVAKPNYMLPNRNIDSENKSKDKIIFYEGDFRLSYTRVAKESCSLYELKELFGDPNGVVTSESINRTNKILESNKKLTPVLESCLLPYGNNIGTVGFNTIYPGGVLNKHYGMTREYIRLHLGIECDPDAVFYVEDYPPRTWELGKIFAFSDGEANHGTVHNGISRRTILIVDVNKRVFSEIKEEKWP